MKTNDQTIQFLNAELLDSDGKPRLTNATIVGDQFIDLSAPPTARALAGAHLADDDDAADGEEGKMISPAHSEV